MNLKLLFILSVLVLLVNAEHLSQGIPYGYKIENVSEKDNTKIIEMIPKNEKIDNWTEKIKTTIIYNNIEESPVEFYSLIASQWEKICKSSKSLLLKTGKQSGYDFALWMVTCPQKLSLSEAEFSWYKAIKGHNSFYFTQKSWRIEPTNQEVLYWTQYLSKLNVHNKKEHKNNHSSSIK